jgi:hypothetical protein
MFELAVAFVIGSFKLEAIVTQVEPIKLKPIFKTYCVGSQQSAPSEVLFFF